MEKLDEFIVYSQAVNAKYINIYKVKEEYCELHITNRQDVDNCVIIDKEDMKKVSSLFWTFGYTGRDKSCIQIYSYQNRHNRIYLKHLIMNDNTDKIYPINRNHLDFRKSNLRLAGDVCRTTRMRQKLGKELPNNIFYIKQRDGKVTGYKKAIKTGSKVKCVCFGIRKYGTLEKCLEVALNYGE